MDGAKMALKQTLSAEHVRFAATVFFVTLLTHALAYLLHEYAHTVTAWALGWMQSPFDIDYGPPTFYNVVFLGKVSDNVNYDLIFSQHHGFQAAAIALAGAFAGNGAVYFLCYVIARKIRSKAPATLMLVLYGISLMSAANVWSYVPIRALTTHADMAIAAQGIGVSSWALFPLLLIPALFIVFHFHEKMLPLAIEFIARGSRIKMALVIVVTSYWYFGFFGDDGIGGSYGTISQAMSILSLYLLFPLSATNFLNRYCLGETLKSVAD